MIELDRQLSTAGFPAGAVVFASSSGGTQAGLMVGKSMTGNDARLLGIRIDKAESAEDPYNAKIASLASQLAERLRLPDDTDPAMSS
jgi:D-cysteine desulfhydrase